MEVLIFRCDSNLLWTGSTCQTCPNDDWKSYGSSCYYFSTSKYSYTKSKTLCSEKSSAATLAILNSVDEFSFVNSTRGSEKTYFVRRNYFLFCGRKF